MIIPVQVRPKAGRNQVSGITRDAAERPVLVIAVTAPPHDGAANSAVQQVLADYLGVPKTALRLCQGAKSRHKQFALTTADAALESRIAAMLSGDHKGDGTDH